MRVPVHIRWLIRRDMPEVLAIDAGCDPELEPWGEDELLRRLRDRHVIGMVAEHGDQVVGFMVYALHRHHIELHRIAVHPNSRRAGVGWAMLAKLARKLQGRHRGIVLDVPGGCLDAHLWLRACGYRATGVSGDTYRFELATDAATAMSDVAS